MSVPRIQEEQKKISLVPIAKALGVPYKDMKSEIPAECAPLVYSILTTAFETALLLAEKAETVTTTTERKSSEAVVSLADIAEKAVAAASDAVADMGKVYREAMADIGRVYRESLAEFVQKINALHQELSPVWESLSKLRTNRGILIRCENGKIEVLVGLRQAAKVKGLTLRAIQKRVHRGTIPVVREGRNVFVRHRDLLV